MDAKDRSCGLNAHVECYRCGAVVSPSELRKEKRPHRCAECGARLDEDGFDEQARKLLVHKEYLKARASLWGLCAEAAISPLVSKGPLSRVHSLETYLVSRARHRRTSLLAKVDRLEKEIQALAYSRYFSGKWFLEGNVPLQRGQNQGITPFYTLQKGYELRPPAKNTCERGVIGEFEVIERFRREAISPQSFLFGSRILHNLYVPCLNMGQDDCFHEADIIVVTTRCLFVIEVKHKRTKVNCTFPKTTRTYGADAVVGKVVSAALRQADQSAEALTAWCKEYPPENVLRMAVFVNPTKFTTNASSFRNRRFVGSCPCDWKKTLTAMEQEFRLHDECLSPEKVNVLADSLQTKLGSMRDVRMALTARREREGARPVFICRKCGTRLGWDDLQGEEEAGASCICGAPLNDAALDGFARQITQEIKHLDHIAQGCAAKVAKEESALLPSLPWRRHVEALRRHEQVRQLRKEEQHARANAAELQCGLRRLAQLRYYGSAWFARTGITLERAEDEYKYHITPFYGERGTFHLDYQWGDVQAESIAAEFRVFEVLCQALATSGSPLRGSVLLPNLYLPRVERGFPGTNVREQVDCVLLTPSCAFVIEVMRRPANILADALTRTVLADGGEGKGLSDVRLLGYPLVAVARHAAQFTLVDTPYSVNSTHEVLVFVDPCSFETTGAGFVGNLYIGCVPQGEQALVEALEKRSRMKKSVLSHDALFALGKRLLATYGTAQGVEVGEHVKKITDGDSGLRLTA
ncbi:MULTISPECIES: nuclease-related domain-containing protein [Gordonibacter]|uniref:Nuclease-related domain-containing protein n=1 Tax=Gordonibacter faecis TaxID=3047475 RepID=A0ABT7DLV0_9ACTN|nr:nuclease-related domain-containing protein [Gordonibacter sp. KGMB12511]MDJ1650514.1 nuclease-related domain-containing protein [Gordonibacter sp. KGMB12511]